MPMDDSTYVGEADAGAFELVVPMEALKHTAVSSSKCNG